MDSSSDFLLFSVLICCCCLDNGGGGGGGRRAFIKCCSFMSMLLTNESIVSLVTVVRTLSVALLFSKLNSIGFSSSLLLELVILFIEASIDLDCLDCFLSLSSLIFCLCTNGAFCGLFGMEVG